MHIILYVLDALRADHLGCYGYGRETSPNIDILAGDGIVFENCFTSSTWTRPVAASLLTSTYPIVHRTRTRYDIFSTQLNRLPEALRAGGFRTAAFSTMGNLASELGFQKGFDHYSELFRDSEILAKRRITESLEEGLFYSSDEKIALPRAEDINDYLFAYLVENRSSDTFSFIWSIETHVPYMAPDDFRRFSSASPFKIGEGERDDIRTAGASDKQRIADLYDDEIYYNDYCIGEIINLLKELGLYDETLFVIAGDHGDAFFEHGVYAHGHAPYDELIHVPLIIKLPHEEHAGKRVSDLVELIDIYPTLLEASGLSLDTKDEEFIQGFNLLSILGGIHEWKRKYVFSDTQMLQFHNRYLSIREQHWKYIQIQTSRRDKRTLINTFNYIIKRRMILDILRSPRHFLRNFFKKSNEYLFNLQADPTEQMNLISDYPEVANELRKRLENWEIENNMLAQKVASFALNYEESEILSRHLKELGYL